MIDFEHAFTRADYRSELVSQSEDQKRVFLQGLEAVCSSDTPHLRELRDWLRSLLEEVEPPARDDREVVERRKVGGGFHQLEKICCGRRIASVRGRITRTLLVSLPEEERQAGESVHWEESTRQCLCLVLSHKFWCGIFSVRWQERELVTSQAVISLALESRSVRLVHQSGV